MDIKIGNKPAGRLRFLLRADIVPMTAGVQTPPKDAQSLKNPLEKKQTLILESILMLLISAHNIYLNLTIIFFIYLETYLCF